MIILSLFTIALLIVVIRQQRRNKLTEAELRRFREHLCKGDVVRLHDGSMGVVTFTGDQVAVVWLESGIEVSVHKELVLPLILN